MPAKRATTTTAVETVDQSETEIERRRPEFPGQNVVLKTIAGRRTLLLNAKPARKSVKKLLPYFYRASLQEPRAVLYVRQQKAESVPARRAATTTAVEIEQSTKLKTNESPNSRVAMSCLKQLVNAKPTRKLVKEPLPYFYRARLQDQDARAVLHVRQQKAANVPAKRAATTKVVETEQSSQSKVSDPSCTSSEWHVRHQLRQTEFSSFTLQVEPLLWALSFGLCKKKTVRSLGLGYRCTVKT